MPHTRDQLPKQKERVTQIGPKLALRLVRHSSKDNVRGAVHVMIPTTIRALAAGLAFMGGVFTVNVNAALTLPSPDCDTTADCIFFGDFAVYSLPVLDLLNPATDFSVQSTPGQIKDDVVVATGASGMPVNTNDDGIDNAYPTPSGAGGAAFFTTAAVTDPSGGDPAMDTDDFWEADISALASYLMGDEFVIFFNLNDTNSDPLLDGQDQLAWAKVEVIDDDGIAPTMTYYFSAQDDRLGVTPGTDEHAIGLADSIAMGGPEADPSVDPAGTGSTGDLSTIDSRWGYVYGEVCIDTGTGLLVRFGKCEAGDPAGSTTVNQNLGADEAAFAVFNKELSDKITDPTTPYDTLRADIRISRIDNGYEQIFIKRGVVEFADDGGEVPTPLTLTLLGPLLVGFGLVARRRV